MAGGSTGLCQTGLKFSVVVKIPSPGENGRPSRSPSPGSLATPFRASTVDCLFAPRAFCATVTVTLFNLVVTSTNHLTW